MAQFHDRSSFSLRAPPSSTVYPSTSAQRIRAVALVLLLTTIFSLPLLRIGRPEGPAYLALSTAGVPDLAIVGNSRPHNGISPREIRRVFAEHGTEDTRIHNFGVDATDALQHASFIEHGLLSGDTTPKVILWTVDALMFDASRTTNHLEQLRVTDVPSLIAVGAPNELWLDVVSMSLFPPYRHRPAVRERIEYNTERAGLLLEPLQPRLFGVERLPARPQPREYVDGGDGHEPFRVLADWHYRFYDRKGRSYAAEFAKFRPSEWHMHFARQALRAARSRGIVVVLVEMPVAPFYRDHFRNLPTHVAWNQAIARLAREEGTPLLTHAEQYHDDSQFGDPGHMPEPTAMEYSGFLARELWALPEVRAALGRR